MITPRNSLWLIPFLLIVTFPLWKVPLGSFLAPRGGYDPKFFSKKKAGHIFSMSKVNILQSEGRKKTADIRAAKAFTSDSPDEYILQKVNADIFNDEGEKTNVRAKRGQYNTLSRRLRLLGKVVVSNKKNHFKMKTRQLFYFDHLGKVHSPEKVTFTGDGITIHGSSFRYDVNKEYYEVGGRVNCIIEGYTPL